MARKFLTAIDLTQQELQNARVQNLGSAPSTPVKGQLYFNTSDSTLYWCENNVGPVWVPAKATGGAFPGYGSVLAETTFGIARSDGAGSTVARADHTHGSPSLGTTPSTQAIGDSAAGGSATDAAKTDHKHAMPAFGAVTTTPTTFGQAKADGAGVAIARADHHHGTPTHDNAAHSAITLNSLAAPTANVSMNNFFLTNVGGPTAATDAATKGYVDNVIAGLSPKEAVRAATTANGALASAFQNAAVIDGVTLATGNRILIKDQSTGAENGIYTVNASGAPTRATDADGVGDLEGAFVFAMEGTVNADKGFICSTNAPITPGSTATTWVLYGAGQVYTAGNGLTLSVNDFNVGAGTGITVAADTVALDTAYMGTNYAAAARTVTAGNGLTGGGDLTANRTLDVGAGTGITVLTDSVAVDFSVAASKTGANQFTGTNQFDQNVVQSVAAPTLATHLTRKDYVDGLVTVKAGKFAQDCAAAATTTVTHNLNTYDVEVAVYTNSGVRDDVEADVERPTINSVLVRFLGTTPTAGQYRIVVQG